MHKLFLIYEKIYLIFNKKKCIQTAGGNIFEKL